jgi:prophage regulatory protein
MESDERLLRRKEVEELTGLSRSGLYRLMEEGRFPRPLKVGRASVRWRLSEVRAWMDGCPRAEG